MDGTLYHDPKRRRDNIQLSRRNLFLLSRRYSLEENNESPFLDPFSISSASHPPPFFFFFSFNPLDSPGSCLFSPDSRPSACQRRFKGIPTVLQFSPWNTSSSGQRKRNDKNEGVPRCSREQQASGSRLKLSISIDELPSTLPYNIRRFSRLGV